MADYYETLGVSRDADDQMIKAAYRKLALQYHPDRNPGDTAAEDRFKEINEAYAVLSDGDKRTHYDRFGTAEVGPQFSGDIFDIFASVFGSGFAGAGRPRQRGRPGEDLEVEIRVTLDQVRAGETVPVAIERQGVCDRCSGSRAEPGTERSTCLTCAGIGQVRAQAQSLLGTVVTTRTCPQCAGAGEIVTDPCSQCQGQGRTREQSSVDVNLPKGIDTGYRLRISQQGNAGLEGGPPGDLYVYIDLEPHEHLQRDGDDLHYDLEIGVAQAALGSSFEVPTLDGPEVIELPAGTQPGSEVCLRGKGMPRLRQLGSGDQVVTVRVETPRRLSARARELLEAYADEVGEEIHEHETLAERIKGLFGRRKRDRDDSDRDDTDKEIAEA